jgi:hypothetical protein
MDNRVIQTSGTYVRASAPGASAIEIEVQAAPSIGGYGYGPGYGRIYDPLKFSQRTFVTWACIGFAGLCTALATGHTFVLLFVAAAVLICLRSSYDVFKWRNGGVYGFDVFAVWCLSPGDWWPIKAEDEPARPPSPALPPRKSTLAPMSYYWRRGIESARNAWFRVQQLPRRLWCAAFGRAVPAPVGTLRLTFEPQAANVLRSRPKYRKG